MRKRGKVEGRFGFDARGLTRWEEPSSPGEFRATLKNTAVTRVLKADELSLVETRPQEPLGSNPYGKAIEKGLRHRSGLDYLRALSEVVKARRRFGKREL